MGEKITESVAVVTSGSGSPAVCTQTGSEVAPRLLAASPAEFSSCSSRSSRPGSAWALPAQCIPDSSAGQRDNSDSIHGSSSKPNWKQEHCSILPTKLRDLKIKIVKTNLTISLPSKNSTDVDGTKIKTIMGLISECVKSPPGVHPPFQRFGNAQQCTLLHRKQDCLVY